MKNLQDTSAIRLFFASRSDREVSRIDEYRHLISKINELKENPNLTLDSIYGFYRQLNLKKDELSFRKFTDSIGRKYTRSEGELRAEIPIDTSNYKTMETQVMVQKVRPFSGAYWEYLLCVAGGALVIALLFQIGRKPCKENKRRNTTTIKKMQNESRFDGDPGQLKELLIFKSENEKLQREIERLREELHEKNLSLKKAELTMAEMENGQMIEEELLQNAVEVPVESPLRESIKRQYFPSPLSDGSFRRVDGRESFLEGASIYCFRLSGDTEASFDFCEEISSVSMALNNRNELILSVAEEMEGNYATAKKISTHKGESGRAVLEDNKWNVVRKVKIKYL
ncbi:hypothetical protein ACFE6N_21430 [Pedobacter sp. BG31]|uniref:hypothetical protein n=1 Tax=Pedobacter sp. BG31 TaxID=3349697 RepID=UPI0035F4706E